MSVPAMELSGIEHHYGYVRALDGIDFHVDPGEVVGLLGDNGAGKSTLLMVMSGAHRPTHGEIRVNGEPQTFHAPKDATAAGIQMVYQDLALVNPQDIATNLNLGEEILRRGPLGWLGFVNHRAQRRRAEEQLDKLGIRSAPMTRPVEMLSGGQRQAIAFARSAIRVSGASGGGVLLLDEPTAALGYEQTRHVEDLIRRLSEQGTAVVVVSHDLPLCFEVTDRMVILNRGRRVADIATADADRDDVVGWITGSRSSMFGP
ncbi:ATP-binding cassette domain-containing protein [Streptomyces sp. NPDC091280]|uniref:ATP-binding cassette domain-containing protein n=1 Tax=Streptomyces sp. NPDC091280 TaxID=3365984 RepID=UPI003827E310